MVIHIDVKHVFKYPIESVAHAHLNKYIIAKDNFVERIDTHEKKVDGLAGLVYRRRIATCTNVVPYLLRKLNLLNEPNIHLEEESWFYHRRRRLELKSRSLTWSHYALLSEESTFEPCETNTKWTVLRQHGMINIHGIGPLGRLIEMFAEGFLHQGVKRGLNNMEQLLHDHHGVPDSNVPSVNKEDGETHTTTNFHSSGT
ncbi:PRELI domain-containing protein 2-like isoform X1 [Lineus longissimus]|uniref:PRELI domain-containing protein 2-like isoform X1 n=1 Tax=Lineus longissimus TaxID=88925 RepID=UPI002B4DAF25